MYGDQSRELVFGYWGLKSWILGLKELSAGSRLKNWLLGGLSHLLLGEIG